MSIIRGSSELLKYVDFIKDEKVKIQSFFSGLTSFYSDKIQYYNHMALEERKASL
jgi:hypothetical protein